jgi:hypothetical protein
MKRLLSILLGMLMTLTVFAVTDSTVQSKDSIHIIVEANPAEVLIRTESIEDSEALQAVLDQQVEQTKVLEQGMRQIDYSIRNTPLAKMQLQQQMLAYENIDLSSLARRQELAKTWSNLATLVIIVLCAIGVLYEKHSYWTRREYISFILGLAAAILLTKVLLFDAIMGQYGQQLAFYDVFKHLF